MATTRFNPSRGSSPASRPYSKNRAHVIFALWCAHILVITVSNYAVQIPCTIPGGIESTVGTFTYPFVFLLTDLTVRLGGQALARRIVMYAMPPAWILSYLFGTLFEHGEFAGLHSLTVFSLFVFRIALASASAYFIGQVLDILVFDRLRRQKAWWVAPAASSTVGNFVDTLVFYAVAFFECPDEYLAANWQALGAVDYTVKLLTALILFVPAYGAILRALLPRVQYQQ